MRIMTRLLIAGMMLILLGAFTESSAGFLPSANLSSMATPRDHHTTTLLQNGKVLIAGGTDNNGNFYDSAELYDPASGTFTATGKMTAPRCFHTATQLPNGKVLITGGAINNTFGSRVSLANAELYDPVSGTFTSTGFLNTARNSHTATLLQSGKVLITGGTYNYNPQNSVELYDPESGNFTTIEGMPLPRIDHTATLLPSGQVLIAGGFTGNGAAVSSMLFDPDSNSWSPTGDLQVSHRFHTATLLQNGQVLITGGDGSSSTSISSAELYDPGSKTFTVLGAGLATARQYHSATLLPNGKVLIAGGFGMSSRLDSAELYDPVTKGFSTVGTMNTARTFQSAALLPNGTVLLTGGGDSNNAPIGSIELYDPAAGGSFTAVGNLATPRGQHSATLLPNGKVLIAGENDKSAELYDPTATTNNWSPAGSMATSHNKTATLLLNGKVLKTGRGSTAAELYDPGTNSWSATRAMNSVRYFYTATLLPNGKVLITGGFDSNFQSLASAELYDPASGEFTPTGNMITARDWHTATLLPNGKVLITGGENSSGSSASILSNAELYDPASGTFNFIGYMTRPRYQHTATLLQSGKVLIADGNSASAELYDPDKGTFRAAGAMKTVRFNYSATLLLNGKVLIAGGVYYNNNYLASTELYDPASNSWSSGANLSTARKDHSATLLPDGKLLIAGGTNNSGSLAGAELYNPVFNTTDSAAALVAYDNRRPLVSAVTFDNNALRISGSKLRGGSEANSGTANSSASNYPLLQLRRIDSDQTSFILPDADIKADWWSDTSFLSRSLYGLPVGHYLASILANAIPGPAGIIRIAPQISTATSTTLDFGYLKYNPGETSASQSVLTIGNTGAADLSFTLSISPAGEFSIASGSGSCAGSLAPGASCTVWAKFSPSSAGSRSAILTVNSNDPDTPQTAITLTGTGCESSYPVALTIDGSGKGTISAITSPAEVWTTCTSSCTQDIILRALLNLSATANPGSFFFGWGAPCSGNGSCCLTVNTPKAVTATFLAYDPPMVSSGSGPKYSIEGALGASGFVPPTNVPPGYIPPAPPIPDGSFSSFGDPTSTMQYKVTATVNGTGGFIAAPAMQVVDYYTKASFTVIPDSNYIVDTANVASTCGGSYNADTGKFTTAFVEKDCSVTIGFIPRTATALSLEGGLVYGQQLVLTAQVNSLASPTMVNSGTITFKDGSTILAANKPVINRFATLAISTLSGGAHQFTAEYSGAAGQFLPSASPAKSLTIAKAASTTTVTSTPTPSIYGQTVTLTATVTTGATGTVIFQEGATTLCSGTVNSSSAKASCGTSVLGSGAHTITAAYGGDNNFNASSGTVTQTVNKAVTTTGVISSPNPSASGQTVTLTATVKAGATGTIDFMDGSTALCSKVALDSSGQAACSVSSLGIGAHTITVSYGGDANFTASSGTVTQNVQLGWQLQVTITGSGSGSVIGVKPSEFKCNSGICSARFPVGTTLNLSAMPDAVSIFDKWTGNCTGSGACSVTMTADKNIIAVFTRAPVAKNSNSNATYTTIAAALSAALPDNEIRVLDVPLAGAITFDKAVILIGGWYATYLTQSGVPTTLTGNLTVQNGASAIKTMELKGTLVIQGGSLQVDKLTVN